MIDAQAFEVQTLFRGVIIGTKQVVRARRRRTRRATFVIGSSAGADAPVAPEYLLEFPPESPDAGAHTLLTAPRGNDDDDRYTVHVTPRMTGVVVNGDRTVALAALVDAHGARFALEPGAHARLQCGAMTFLLAATERAPIVAAAPIDWRAPAHRYHLASALGVTAVLLMLLAVPGDPRSLALDLFAPERGLVKFLIKPPVPAAQPPADGSPAAPGGGHRDPGAREPAGAASQPGTREADLRHPSARDGRATALPADRRPSPTSVNADQAGVLGVLRRLAPASAIFAPGSAFGRDAETVLGQLDAVEVGMADGPGGLAAVGTGSGGDTGAPVLGIPHLGTIGPGGDGPSSDRHYGDTAGRLQPRPPRRPPDIVIGETRVTGALDREIVRRIIRRHINEVKFCYEQGLATRATLGGRIQVQFTIAASGQVLTSVLQSSTLGNARVESCAVQAVRRWEFPRPVGGGLVMVSYPFVLTPAGGTD